MAQIATRGWFQCPDSGEEVCVIVYERPCRARVRPTSSDPDDRATLDWVDRFDGYGPVGIGETLCVLEAMGMRPVYDVNWE